MTFLIEYFYPIGRGTGFVKLAILALVKDELYESVKSHLARCHKHPFDQKSINKFKKLK